MQSDAKTFIFFSSVKAAADSVPGDVLTGDVLPELVGPYCESKIRGEYILNYMKRDTGAMVISSLSSSSRLSHP